MTTPNPQIGDIRRTSNGCTVAKCVPRKEAGCRSPSNNIAAIDFGTTNCSVAYIISENGSEQTHTIPPEMLAFDSNITRVPTAILFNPEGTVEAFGINARKCYSNRVKADGAGGLMWAYFDEIKMHLQHDEVLTACNYIYYILLCSYSCMGHII